jgi:outer membrane beta-barrel protein
VLRLAACAALLATLCSCSLLQGRHQQPQPQPQPSTNQQPPDDEPSGEVINPDIARRHITVPKIKTSNLEVGLFTGIISVESLQSHLIYGTRLDYHVSEDFFLEGEYAHSQVSDQVRREIGQPFFPQEVIGLDTYGVSLGYNLLPGEVFAGTRYAMNSTLYLLIGGGNTSFNDEDFLTYNAGFGLKVLPTDWLSVRLEARDRLWNSDVLGSKKMTNNFETTLGIACYF